MLPYVTEIAALEASLAMLRVPAVSPECHRPPSKSVSRFTAFVKGNWKWAVYRVGVYDNLPRRHCRRCEREELSFAVKVC